MLELFRVANFSWLFIGIESPDEASLRETKKTQNTNQDMLASVRTIYSYGLDVLGGFIIGFDNDTVDIFDKQRRFIEDSGIVLSMVGLLTAVPKTPLYERLAREDRLIPNTLTGDNSKLRTNVMPKRMTYDEMVDGYRELNNDLFTDRGISARIRNKVRYFSRQHFIAEFSFQENLQILWRFLIKGLLPGGLSRLFYFLRSMPLHRPKIIPVVISSWSMGLSMQDYMARHFVREFQHDSKRVRRHVDKMQRVFRDRCHKGALDVTARESANAAAAVRISMTGRVEPVSFRSVAAHVEHLLKKTRSSVTLQIAKFPREQLGQLSSLLNRLSTYGDRIHIHLDEESRRIVPIDSSVFNLAMGSERQ